MQRLGEAKNVVMEGECSGAESAKPGLVLRVVVEKGFVWLRGPAVLLVVDGAAAHSVEAGRVAGPGWRIIFE